VLDLTLSALTAPLVNRRKYVLSIKRRAFNLLYRERIRALVAATSTALVREEGSTAWMTLEVEVTDRDDRKKHVLVSQTCFHMRGTFSKTQIGLSWKN